MLWTSKKCECNPTKHIPLASLSWKLRCTFTSALFLNLVCQLPYNIYWGYLPVGVVLTFRSGYGKKWQKSCAMSKHLLLLGSLLIWVNTVIIPWPEAPIINTNILHKNKFVFHSKCQFSLEGLNQLKFISWKSCILSDIMYFTLIIDYKCSCTCSRIRSQIT